MRKLARPKVKLPTIVEIEQLGTAWMKGVPPIPTDGKWNKADVRGALYAMHGRGCAYCQKDLLSTRGDVDHFRPQSRYPWLKYSFQNYLLSCDTCNSIYKVANFPLSDDASPFGYERADDINTEPRLLLDPSIDDVEAWICFDIDDPICPAIPKREIGDTPASAQVQRTIQFFQLNLDVRLVKSRFQAVNEALIRLDTINQSDQTNVQSTIDALRKSSSRYRPHGIAIRGLLEKYAPKLLPSREEELFWHIDEYVSDLSTIDTIRRRNSDAEHLRRLDREEAECYYALAVIVQDPPAASMEEISKHLEKSGRFEQVKRYLDKLE